MKNVGTVSIEDLTEVITQVKNSDDLRSYIAYHDGIEYTSDQWMALTMTTNELVSGSVDLYIHKTSAPEGTNRKFHLLVLLAALSGAERDIFDDWRDEAVEWAHDFYASNWIMIDKCELTWSKIEPAIDVLRSINVALTAVR